MNKLKLIYHDLIVLVIVITSIVFINSADVVFNNSGAVVCKDIHVSTITFSDGKINSVDSLYMGHITTSTSYKTISTIGG